MQTKLWSIFIIVLLAVADAKKIGFAFSGGGANFGQEAALMETLYKGLQPSGQKIRPTEVSGASAGSIAALALNAIMQSEAGGPSFSWDDFHTMLWGLTQSAIMDTSFAGIQRIFTTNIPNGFIVDNTPLRTLLSGFFTRVGWNVLGDVYLPTIISVVDRDSGVTYRLSSENPAHQQIPLVDIIMASAAIPMVFTPVYIKELNKTFIDGGSGNDMIPLFALLERHVDEVYIIAREQDIGAESGLPSFLQPLKLVTNTFAFLEVMKQALFFSAMEQAMTAAVPCYAYVPKLPVDYSAFNFDVEKPMWYDTMFWAGRNDPIRLNPSLDQNCRNSTTAAIAKKMLY
jgi:predicted acylesterase/phospholipase RssA